MYLCNVVLSGISVESVTTVKAPVEGAGLCGEGDQTRKLQSPIWSISLKCYLVEVVGFNCLCGDTFFSSFPWNSTRKKFTKRLAFLFQLDVFDAAERYKQAGHPLIVLAGKEYGAGSSRDWAAKGPFLLVSGYSKLGGQN